MTKNKNLKESLSIITNKINPLYKKEIRDLGDLISAKKLEKELDTNECLNLRGIGLDLKEFKNSDISNEIDGVFSLQNNYMITSSINDIDYIDPSTLTIATKNGIYMYNSLRNAVIYFIPTLNSINTITKLDEDTIAFGGDDNKVTIFNYKTKEVLHEQKVSFSVWAISRLDEDTIAFGGHDNKVTIFNYKTKKVLHEQETYSWVYAIIKLNEDTIAFGGYNNKVTIFNFKTKKVLYEQKVSGYVRAISRLDEDTIAFGGDDRKVTIFNYKTKEVLHEQETSGWVYAIIKLNEDTIAFGGGDNKVTIFNYKTKKVLHEQETSGWVYAISRLDEDTIAFGGGDGKVTIFKWRDKPSAILEVKSFDDGIVTLYEPKEKQLTLINRKRDFTPENDPLLYRHGWYVNESLRLEPYFKFPDRWKFDKEEADRIVLH